MDCPKCGAFSSMQAESCDDCGYEFPRAASAEERRQRTRAKAERAAERDRRWRANPEVKLALGRLDALAVAFRSVAFWGRFHAIAIPMSIAFLRGGVGVGSSDETFVVFASVAALGVALLGVGARSLVLLGRAEVTPSTNRIRALAVIAFQIVLFLVEPLLVRAPEPLLSELGMAWYSALQLLVFAVHTLLLARLVRENSAELGIELSKLEWFEKGALAIAVAVPLNQLFITALGNDTSARALFTLAWLGFVVLLIIAHQVVTTTFRVSAELLQTVSTEPAPPSEPPPKKRRAKRGRPKTEALPEASAVDPSDADALFEKAILLGDGDDDEPLDRAAELVRTAGREPRSAHVALVRRTYPQLGEAARAAALGILASFASEHDDAAGRRAIRVLLELLRQHGWPKRDADQCLSHLESSFAHADLSFPELVDGQVAGSGPGFALCLAYLRVEALEPKRLEPASDVIVETCSAALTDVAEAQEEQGIAWRWRDDYLPKRHRASVLLDLLGYLPKSRVHATLKQALTLRDPRPLCFAIGSLAKLGCDIPKRVLETVAASDEMRTALAQLLAHSDRLELFPKQFLDEKAVARATFVNWLTFPSELGREPDELELMKVITREVEEAESEQEARYYVFRFRTHPPHWAAEDGWTAGIAGPYADDDGGEFDHTFSRFEPWSNADAAGHLESILDTVRATHTGRT